MKLFRWWLANPAASFLLSMLFAVVCVEAAPLVSYASMVIAFASAVQGLRALWRRSPLLAILVGAGIPAFGTLAVLASEPDRSLVLLWFPAALAIFVELTVRAVRRSKGLPELEAAPPAKPQPDAKTSRGRGCLIAVLMLALFVLYFAWVLRAPRIAAEDFKARLRVGMTLSDVVAASFGTGPHFVFVRGPEAAPKLQVSGSTVTIEGERAEGEQGVRALLDRKASELRVDSLSVMFLTSVPVRSSIVVRFGPDGRATAIEGPFDRAD